MRIQPVLLSGGIGKRLWPLSRAHKPKQFLPLIGGKSPLQETFERIIDARLFLPPMVIANQTHEGLVKAQARQAGMDSMQLVLEPMARNTAASVALAALLAQTVDGIQLILPVDSYITDDEVFIKSVTLGAKLLAQQDRLVTFGIPPYKPETAYGYIRAGQESDIKGAFAIAQFKEKPDRAMAQKWLATGDYSWNSGMLMCRPQFMLAQMRLYCPTLLAACEKACQEVGKAVWESARDKYYFLRLADTHFATMPALPIDIAIMEKTKFGIVIPANMGWLDIGSWSSLYKMNKMHKSRAGRRGNGFALLSVLMSARILIAMGISFMCKALYWGWRRLQNLFAYGRGLDK